MHRDNIPREYLPPAEFMPRNIKSLPELEYSRSLNLAETLLDRHIPERGDSVAIYCESQRITYRQLQFDVNRFANALRSLGVRKGHRVALRSPNIPEYFVWNFACWRIGAIPVLMSHHDRSSEIVFKINDSDALAICVHSDFYDDVSKAQNQCLNLKHVIVVGTKLPGTISYQELLNEHSDETVTEDTSCEDFARIIYSSGTTGKPKGVLSTSEGILSACDTYAHQILRLQSGDVLGGHPFYSFAFGGSFLIFPWRFGAAVSIITHFSPERQFELIGEHGITILLAVPTAFRMMLGVVDAEHKYPMATLRVCQTAGEPLPETTFREWRARFGHNVLNSLGSSELNYWLTTFEGMPDDKIGSSGRSVPGYENVVVDDALNPVRSGVPGELIVRGPVGQVYWRRPDAQRNGVCPPDSQYAGWSRPGLYFVEDEDGYFWYKSRIDDMIVTSGYKVPGGEVEGALNNHPAVLESAVIGKPDRERGNVIKAFVVLKQGVAPDTQLIHILQEFVKQEIEPYKYPRLIEFVSKDAMPRTVTGKIQRKALRDLEIARGIGDRPVVDSRFVSDVRQLTEDAFASGLYCAEAVVSGLAKAQGLESDLLSRLATGFCSGMARTCGPCGALTGAVMGVGLLLGRSRPGESVHNSYAVTQELIHEFEREFGARNCHDLLGCDLGTPSGQAKFHEERLQDRCALFTTRAAEMAAVLIDKAKK